VASSLPLDREASKCDRGATSSAVSLSLKSLLTGATALAARLRVNDGALIAVASEGALECSSLAIACN
jgi:hypothetical protein